MCSCFHHETIRLSAFQYVEKITAIFNKRLDEGNIAHAVNEKDDKFFEVGLISFGKQIKPDVFFTESTRNLKKKFLQQSLCNPTQVSLIGNLQHNFNKSPQHFFAPQSQKGPNSIICRSPRKCWKVPFEFGGGLISFFLAQEKADKKMPLKMVRVEERFIAKIGVCVLCR